MNPEGIVFRLDSASPQVIGGHLLACDRDFVPPLSERVEIADYAGKLRQRAVTFEAWDDAVLVGLVAAYFDTQPATRSVFISSISVLKSHASRGIATRLIRLCLEQAAAGNAESVELEVSREHERALALYSRLGFLEAGNKGPSILMKLQLSRLAGHEE